MYIPVEVLARIQFEHDALKDNERQVTIRIEDDPAEVGQNWYVKFTRFGYKEFTYKINYLGQIIEVKIENNSAG